MSEDALNIQNPAQSILQVSSSRQKELKDRLNELLGKTKDSYYLK